MRDPGCSKGDLRARRPRGPLACGAARVLLLEASLLLLLALLSGCTNLFGPDLGPRPLDALERGEYEGPPPRYLGEVGPDSETVERLARVFYVRIINRRFNSISTFHDPALRELFQSAEAFADYFASLADELTNAHFEALRPEAMWLERIDTREPGQVFVTVRFRGQNSLPLRWWSVDLVRTDRWEQSDDRWWIIPGKL